MANFNEHSLELSIMELFKDEGYTYFAGEQIHRERTEVLLVVTCGSIYITAMPRTVSLQGK